METGVRLRLFFEVKGRGKPVLFVYGFPASHEVWDSQVTALAKRYTTVVYDRRGHGQSDKPGGQYSYEIHIQDLNALIDKLGIENCTLIGWSMGTAIGLGYITQFDKGVTKFVSVGGAIPQGVSTDNIPCGLSRQTIQSWIHEEKIAAA